MPRSDLSLTVRTLLAKKYKSISSTIVMQTKNKGKLCPNWNPIALAWDPCKPGYDTPIPIDEISKGYASAIVAFVARKGYLPIPELEAIVASPTEVENNGASSNLGRPPTNVTIRSEF